VSWITRRRLAWTAGGLLVFVLLAVGTAILVLQSDWFFNKIRLRLVSVVENATGGRADIGSFHFDWHNLRAEVHDIVVRGTEPPGKPPLLRARRVVVGIKLISLSRHEVDIQSLTVTEPHIYLIVAPDGSTNIPKPKAHSNKDVTETLLDAAIGHVTIERGITELETHGTTPFGFRGENVVVNLAYDRSGPRYRGTFASAPMRISYDDYGPEPFQVNVAFAIEKGRIAVDSARFVDGKTQVDAKGVLEDLKNVHAAFQFTARAQLTDIARIFRVRELRGGSAIVTGTARIEPGAGLSVDGILHTTDTEYRDRTIRLTGFRVQGNVRLHDKIVSAANLHLSGDFVSGNKRERIEGRIADLKLVTKDLDLHGVAVAVLNGEFRGDVRVRNFDRYTAEGAISGIDARRAAALFTSEALPWNALVFGPIRLEGSFRRSQDLRASANLTISPAPSGDPVSGQINAMYDARSGNLDLGRSTISLPHTRADFSGSLGRTMLVHLETTDLNDMLPVLGANASAIPVTLKNGSVIFDGTVTGNLSSPQIAGHLSAASFAWQQGQVDRLEADVQASPDYLRLQNATAVRGAVRAQFQGSIGLSDWKTSDASPISATASISNASAPDLLALARAKEVPLSATISGSAVVNGTLGKMTGQADITAVQGVFRGEPFDRFTAHATYASDTLTVSNAQVVAGTKQATINATYHHVPDHFDQGRIHFQLATDPSPVEQIRTFAEQRPDLKGTVQVTASGDIDLTPAAKTPYRIVDLHADVIAKGIQFEGQPVGDAHITATSEGGILRAHVDSTIAGSEVRGDGQWRLEGDYPGSATLQFTKVDLARLKDWLSPGTTPADFAGSAEGELRIEGPAENWRANHAELRIRQFRISANPGVTTANQPLVVRNSGDLVFRLANNTITAESAHFVGPGTDLALTGRIQPELKAPLDLRVAGKIDLSFLHDLLPDIVASGGVATNATIRGIFGDPQVVGRMEFQGANLSFADVPNGISNARGAITFNKDRAQIESLTGETGGGRIQLTGFASYGASHPIVFRLHAIASEVRVRYPEGVSTVANANLNLTGTAQSSMLSGTVTVLRTTVNVQSDFSGILAKSAQPIQTPSAKPGLLGGMSFDIQIDTAPDIQLQSALTENVQAEATLRLRGTASNPALLGRVNITQGKLNFFGTSFVLSQGSVSFYNPVRIEPIINIDLETKVRGVDIILTISGPLNKLTLTPRSDPPLQFSEIVALLATGRTPTSDPSMWNQQTSAQSWQQMGASALLGSAIANPVAGRLQRFFGVSRLRIDPTIAGVDNTPQARVTVEQQVTPEVTFTYIQNVTATNSQVIRVEWAFSKQWSAVALRDENGVFGLDFYYKKRFK
jgi:translocation and assembly module TamB